MSKNTAPVDIRHDHHRTVCRFGKAHIGDIVFPQIDLGRTSRPFHQHRLILSCESVVAE